MTDVNLRVQVGKDLWAMYRKARSFASASGNDGLVDDFFATSQNGYNDWDSKSV